MAEKMKFYLTNSLRGTVYLDIDYDTTSLSSQDINDRYRYIERINSVASNPWDIYVGQVIAETHGDIPMGWHDATVTTLDVQLQILIDRIEFKPFGYEYYIKDICMPKNGFADIRGIICIKASDPDDLFRNPIIHSFVRKEVKAYWETNYPELVKLL